MILYIMYQLFKNIGHETTNIGLATIMIIRDHFYGRVRIHSKIFSVDFESYKDGKMFKDIYFKRNQAACLWTRSISQFIDPAGNLPKKSSQYPAN